MLNRRKFIQLLGGMFAPYQLMGAGSGGGGGGYSGPGNIVSGAVAWYGLRAYTAASIGSNCVKLRRDSDNATSTFVTVSGGGVDIASIATFKGAANLFVDTLYDQTGNGNDVVQATTANQPAFTLSGLGSLPIITFNGSTDILASAGVTVNTIDPFTISYVAERTGLTTALNCVHGSNTGGSSHVIAGFQSANRAAIYQGTDVVEAVANDNAWHAIQATYNQASSEIYVDGSGTAVNTNNNISFVNSNMCLGNSFAGSHPFSGNYVESGVWNTGFSAGNKSDMNTNQHNYWGF